MLTLEDCIALSDLTEEEILPMPRTSIQIAAAELGNTVRNIDGEWVIRR